MKKWFKIDDIKMMVFDINLKLKFFFIELLKLCWVIIKVERIFW